MLGRQIKVALNKVHEIGFDKKPLIVKSQDVSLNNQSKIYRYTDRRNQLMTGELEYSIVGKSFHGRGIYFGNANSDIGGYHRDDKHELVTATLKDDTILVDKEKVSEVVKNSGIDIREAGIGELGNDTRQAVWSMVAMDVGIDGFINQKLGYVVLFNRGKLVILDD